MKRRRKPKQAVMGFTCESKDELVTVQRGKFSEFVAIPRGIVSVILPGLGEMSIELVKDHIEIAVHSRNVFDHEAITTRAANVFQVRILKNERR